MQVWYHGPCVMSFESTSTLKEIVSIAGNLTRLEIETDRYVKNIVFATTFSI